MKTLNSTEEKTLLLEQYAERMALSVMAVPILPTA